MANLWFLLGGMGAGKTSHMFYLRQEFARKDAPSISWRLPSQHPEQSRAYKGLEIGEHRVIAGKIDIGSFPGTIMQVFKDTPNGSFVVLPDLLLFEASWREVKVPQDNMVKTWAWCLEYIVQQTDLKNLITIAPINPVFSIGDVCSFMEIIFDFNRGSIVLMGQKCKVKNCFAYSRPVMPKRAITNLKKDDYHPLCKAHEEADLATLVPELETDRRRYFKHYGAPSEWALNFYNKYMREGKKVSIYIHDGILEACSEFLHSYPDRKFVFNLRTYETDARFWPGHSYKGAIPMSRIETCCCRVCAFLETVGETLAKNVDRPFLEIEERPLTIHK